MVWKVAERKVVGEAEISKTPPPGYVPPSVYVPPAAPPGPAFAAAKAPEKKIPTEFLARHRLIKSFIDKEGKKYLCPNISDIVAKTSLDEETVKQHVSVMEFDEAVALMQEVDNCPVCSVDGLNRLVENLRKLRT